MSNIRFPSLSKFSQEALKLIGLQIRTARLERGISQQNLGERINASRFTVIAIEKGDPKVSVGYVFEAAITVGVPLLGETLDELKKTKMSVSHVAALTRKTARKKKEDFDDDF